MFSVCFLLFYFLCYCAYYLGDTLLRDPMRKQLYFKDAFYESCSQCVHFKRCDLRLFMTDNIVLILSTKTTVASCFSYWKTSGSPIEVDSVTYVYEDDYEENSPEEISADFTF